MYIIVILLFIIYYKQKLIEKRNKIEININDTVYLSNKEIESYGCVIDKNSESNIYDVYTYKDKSIHYNISNEELTFRNKKDQNNSIGIITNINIDNNNNNNISYNITFENDQFAFEVEERFIKGKLDDNNVFITSIEHKYKKKHKKCIEKIKIGDYVIVSSKSDKNVKEKICQIIKLNAGNCTVRINGVIILTDIPYSQIELIETEESIKKKDIQSKYKVGDVVFINRYYNNYNFVCYNFKKNLKMGVIIGYNFNKNKPIIKVKYNDELLSLLNDKIEIENSLLVGDVIDVEKEEDDKKKQNIRKNDESTIIIRCKIKYVFDNSNYYCEVEDSDEIIPVEKNKIKTIINSPKLLNVINFKINKDKNYMLKCVIMKRNDDKTVNILLKDGYLLERIDLSNIIIK